MFTPVRLNVASLARFLARIQPRVLAVSALRVRSLLSLLSIRAVYAMVSLRSHGSNFLQLLGTREGVTFSGQGVFRPHRPTSARHLLLDFSKLGAGLWY
ncbi:hypothetical protein DL95DRAFT_134415 [Leptodontidium sp. 2 PMI_412]|nr:hypothetical protein DL95DRAFT_134415 [Leptodontidium sp. 2 PMI_412]